MASRIDDRFDRMDLPPRGPDPELARLAEEGPHRNDSLSETARDVAQEVKGKVASVSRAELEAFLAQAVRLFLRGGLHVHHEGRELPDLEIKITDDTVRVNVRNLDAALAWNLADGPADVGAPEPRPDQVLDHFRVFVHIEDELVAALGRGIPGVQVRTGRASFLLFKDFVKGLLQDKTWAEREKERDHQRDLLRREIEESRRRTGAVPAPGTAPARVDPGQEDLPGPSRH